MRYLLIFLTGCLISSSIYADTTFVSGTIVSETWTPTGSPYCVVGNIFVAGLTIQPGVKVLFLGDYEFEVAGILTAVGTEQDSIQFTKADTVSGWQGMYFNQSVLGSELEYCLIEGSINSGIRITNSTPFIKSCTISNNSSDTHGGGISANLTSGTSLILEGCTIVNNTTNPTNTVGNYEGGGIYVDGDCIIKNCIIKENTCFARCNSGGGCDTYARGGGIYFANGNANLSNCIISYNLARAHSHGPSPLNGFSYALGGGIYVDSGSMTLENCIVSYDTSYATCAGSWCGAGGGGATSSGSGIYLNSGIADIINSTLAYNDNHGLRREGGTATLLNSIVYFNNDGGVQISGDVSATYTDIQGGYSGIGNIDFNPIFKSQDNLIIVLGSLCVDAGDPNTFYNDVCFPPSLGSVRNDMGAHGGPGACGWVEPITGIEDEIIGNATQYYLEQNYPNPFNPSTRIQYAISSRQFVTLKIYDVLGNEVATLVNEEKVAGNYVVDFSVAQNSILSSGIYFYRLQAGSYIETKKMILMK